MRTLTIILLLAGCKYQTSSTRTQIEGPDAGHDHDTGCHNGSNDGGGLPDAYVYTNDAWPDAEYRGAPDGGSYYPDGGSYYPDAGP